MKFQKIILFIALILLIISFLIFGAMIYTNSVAYPPVQAQCPDYWVDMSGGIGTGGYFLNTQNLGKGSCPNKMNFNTGLWTGDDGLCNKKKWAKACDLTWDGVTNNPKGCGDEDLDDEDLLSSAATSSNQQYEESNANGFTSELF